MTQAAFQAAAHDWVENQPSMPRNYIYLKQAVDMLLTLMPREYFAQDHELQARLHNIIVRGYPAWGKIPQNTDELYAALLDMGIKSPSIVREYLARPEQEQLRKIFNQHSSLLEGHWNPSTAEMNIGLNSARSSTVLEQGWKDCLPALYGVLLEYYGDSSGRAKMGYSPVEEDVLGLPMKQEYTPT